MCTTPIAFSLFAPRNQHVALVGSWNNWQPQPMTQDDQGTWRADVPLEDGEFEYQFEVISNSSATEGQTLRVADPVAARLTADGKTHLMVQDGKAIVTSYTWHHDQNFLPSNEQLVIYELHVGDFSGGPGDEKDGGREGNFQDILGKLDYLAELGINAIELMPVNEFAAPHDWGYSQMSLYAVESHYGTPDDLCRLVDECHARGIRVLHDVVYNHLDLNAYLLQIDNGYWFYEENPDKKELQFGPKLNYDYFDEVLQVWPARKHAFEAMRFWLHTFHLDGLRFDATRALRDFDLLNMFCTEMHESTQIAPLIAIAEHVPEDPAVVGPDGPLDAAWRDRFGKQMVATIIGQEKDGQPAHNTQALLEMLDPRNQGYPSAYNVVNFIDNHDQDHIMWQLGQAGVLDAAAFRRMKLGATLLLTAPGIPLLWMGQEFGQATPRGETHEPKPLEWSLLHNEPNHDLMQFYARMIRLRKETPALYSDSFEVIADVPEQEVIAYKRWNDAGNVVIVVANLRDEPSGEVHLESAGIDNGRWNEALRQGSSIEVDNHTLLIKLAESEVKVLIKES